MLSDTTFRDKFKFFKLYKLKKISKGEFEYLNSLLTKKQSDLFSWHLEKIPNDIDDDVLAYIRSIKNPKVKREIIDDIHDKKMRNTLTRNAASNERDLTEGVWDLQHLALDTRVTDTTCYISFLNLNKKFWEYV